MLMQSELMSRISHQVLNYQTNLQATLFFKEVSTNRSDDSQIFFKRTLVDRYQNGMKKKMNTNKKGEVMWETLRCMVTGVELCYSNCIAGHIVPHCASHGLLAFGVYPDQIDNEDNGLLWAQGIEDVFHPPGQVCILYNFIHQRLHFMVLDPNLLKETVTGTNLRFCDIHDKVIEANNKFPRLRYLWVHAITGINIAGDRDWLDPNSDEWKLPLDTMQNAMNILAEGVSKNSEDAAKAVVENMLEVESTGSGVAVVGGRRPTSTEIDTHVSNSILCQTCHISKPRAKFSRKQKQKLHNRKKNSIVSCEECVESNKQVN